MRFSQLLHSHATVDTGQDEALAVPADLTPVLSWQANLCCHSYSSRGVRVLLRQYWVLIKGFPCQAEERLNALSRYASDVVVHLAHPSPSSLCLSPLTYLLFQCKPFLNWPFFCCCISAFFGNLRLLCVFCSWVD